MTNAGVVLACVLVAALAAALWWRLAAPGKRLRFGAFTLYHTRAVTEDVANRVAQHLMRENFAHQQMDARLTLVPHR